MNKLTRNLILPAAALAALLLAPNSEARDFGSNRGHESREYGRNSFERRGYEGRGYDRRERGWRQNGHYAAPRYVAPIRGYRHAAPFRVISGHRFYSYCPGPGWVYVAGGGWVLPPFFGAVWVPPHFDIGGFWVEGYWR